MEITPLSLIIPDFYVGPNLQAAVNQANLSPKAAVWIPANYAGTDTYTNPSNVPVYDMRGAGSTSFSSATAIVTSNPATCTVGQQFFNTTTGQLLTCTATNTLSNGGSSSFPVTTAVTVGTGGSITATGTGSLTATNFNGAGPNPYIDIRAFGAVAVNTSTAPFTTGITASCNGTTTVTLSSASSFVNGQGVDLWGCGATNTLSTPSAPTVSCVLAAAPPGTGYVVPCAAGGSETTCYTNRARTKGQGVTAASSETCVTGQTRGQITVNLTSCVRSANTLVTCTTSSAHTLATGAQIYIHGTTFDSEYAGWFIVAGSTDNTHFTYQWQRDSRTGASTVAGAGGTVTYWQGNHITFNGGTAPPAGVWQYAVYRGASGAETLTDVSTLVNPIINLDSSYMTWDDFGTTYTTVPQLPAFWPSSTSSPATNDTLVTTISSGAGTTTLTLANSASQTLGGTTILSDNAPNYLAAFTASLSSHGMVYVPAVASGSFATNSILDISSVGGIGVSVAGPMYFGDTLVSNSDWLAIPSYLQSPQFGLRHYLPITIAAKPGISIVNGSWKGFIFNPIGTNCQQFYINGGNIPTALFEDVAFPGSSNSADYSCVPIYMFTQGNAGNGAAGVKFTNVVINGQATGATPALISKNFGEINIDGVIGANRGFFFGVCPTCTGSGVFFNQRYEVQGLNMPYITLRGTMLLNLSNVVEDTGSQPIIFNVGQSPVTLILSSVAVPQQGVPQITGYPSIYSITGTDSLTNQGVNLNYSGQVTGLIEDGIYNTTQAIQSQNTHFILGQNYSLFTASGSYAAPTCSVVSAGPPFSLSADGANTYNFAYAPIFVNGGMGVVSPTVSCAMDGATQQATITIPIAVPGAVSYQLFFGAGGGGASLGNEVITPFTTLAMLVPSCSGGCQGASSPGFSGGGPAGFQNGKVWGTTIQLGMTTFATLGAPTNGIFVYCPDCTIANPCAGSGTGALAKRLNGTWVCN